MLGWDIDAGSRLLVADLSVGRGRISGSGARVWGWGLGIRVPIKAFVDATNCYVSDLEEREKTLLLHEREGKLSRVRSRLIYRFSRGLSVPRAGLHSGAEADRSGTVTVISISVVIVVILNCFVYK